MFDLDTIKRINQLAAESPRKPYTPWDANEVIDQYPLPIPYLPVGHRDYALVKQYEFEHASLWTTQGTPNALQRFIIANLPSGYAYAWVGWWANENPVLGVFKPVYDKPAVGNPVTEREVKQ